MRKPLEEELGGKIRAVVKTSNQCILLLFMCLGKFDLLKKQRNDLNLIKAENFCCQCKMGL